jgi:molybdenum cofactor cytidylyltransferase
MIAAVLLAAGGGSRFRATATEKGLDVSHKLLAPLGGRSVVERSYDAMHEGAPANAPRIVVRGAALLPALLCANVIPNPRWAEGQASSLWAALGAATDLGCTGVVVGLGDQPFVAADDWQAMFVAADGGAVIAVATYDGRRRNPVYLHESVWPLIPREGDEGARSVLAENPALVTEVACSGNPADIDTAEDLLRWS